MVVFSLFNAKEVISISETRLKTSVTYKGTGTQTQYDFPFDYLRKSFIKVKIDDVLQDTSEYNVDNRSILFNTAPAADSIIIIYRETATERLVSWADASVLKASDMTISQVQQLHILEEGQDWSKLNTIYLDKTDNSWEGNNHKIKNVSYPVNDDDVVTKGYMETVQDGFVMANTALKDEATKQAGIATKIATDLGLVDEAVTNAQNAATQSETASNEVKEIYNDGNLTPLSDLLGSLGTKLKRWGTIFANKVFASNLPIVYNSVAEMKADTILWEGMNTKTLGYYTHNDGGGASYLIRAKADSDTVDNGSLHELANGLVAELIIENGTVNVKQFGAVGDGVTDDSDAIQLALNNNSVLMPAGNYLITKHISILNCHNIIGEKGSSLIIVADYSIEGQVNNGVNLLFKNIDGLVIKNITIKEKEQASKRVPTYDFSFAGCSNFIIENVEVYNTSGPGMFLAYQCENFTIDNCYVHHTKADGIHIQSGCKNFVVSNCLAEYTEDDCFAAVSHNADVYGVVQYGKFINNTAHDTLVTGSGFCFDGSSDIICENNIVYNTQLSSVRSNRFRETEQSSYFLPNNIIISNNKFSKAGLNENVSSRYGVELNLSKSHFIINNEFSDIPKSAVYSTSVGKLVVKNNLVNNCSLLATCGSSNSQTYSDECHYDISDNHVTNCTGGGVFVPGTFSITSIDKATVRICNNIFVNMHKNSSTLATITVYSSGLVLATNNLMQSNTEGYTDLAFSGNTALVNTGNVKK